MDEELVDAIHLLLSTVGRMKEARRVVADGDELDQWERVARAMDHAREVLGERAKGIAGVPL